MFCKWSCGCIGLQVDGECWMILACDSTDYGDTFQLHKREDLKTKKFDPLPKEAIEALLQDMSRVLHAGYKFYELKNILES